MTMEIYASSTAWFGNLKVLLETIAGRSKARARYTYLKVTSHFDRLKNQLKSDRDKHRHIKVSRCIHCPNKLGANMGRTGSNIDAVGSLLPDSSRHWECLV
jgi:hypothetical protein